MLIVRIILQGIFAPPALGSIDQFCRSARGVRLKKHYRWQIKAIVLGRENARIPGPVMRESQEEIVNAHHRLAFGESVEIELVLQVAIDVLQTVSSPNFRESRNVTEQIPYGSPHSRSH
jgi:hypothetical protein